MNKRKIAIYTSISIVGIAASYFVYTKIRNANEIKFIHKELDGAGGYGTIKDFAKVFEGTNYINGLKAKYPNLILLRNEYITEARTKLNKAISGIGTDTDTVKAVFRNLKDKVQIAQIADSYQRNYNTNLLDAIMDEYSFREGSSDANELLNIMKSKLDYRVSA
ncbi:hypothetical protein COY27_03890 [Candidatus Woesearchaeota archaeon CG_4_10_14_0_2_um_filter_33_13]|nr:MAG: hypothetical protein COY27_03890 [Candidatus Woesearchaeota archaeon CG_4_10_14_0_2_um_filter_33_13]